MTRRECSFPGCDRPVRTKDFCDTHYRQWWKHGRTHPINSTPPTGRPRTLTDAQVQEAGRLYDEGMTGREVARTFGITHPAMMRCLAGAGTQIRPRGGYHHPRVDLPREAFPDPVWGTREFGRMMSGAPRWSGKHGSYS